MMSLAYAVTASLTMDAPTALKLASGTLALTPAPACTTTVCPAAINFFTVSGVAATRVSPAMISAGIPICMVNPQSEFHNEDLNTNGQLFVTNNTLVAH